MMRPSLERWTIEAAWRLPERREPWEGERESDQLVVGKLSGRRKPSSVGWPLVEERGPLLMWGPCWWRRAKASQTLLPGCLGEGEERKRRGWNACGWLGGPAAMRRVERSAQSSDSLSMVRGGLGGAGCTVATYWDHGQRVMA